MPLSRPATQKSFRIERPLPFELTALLLATALSTAATQKGLVSDEGR